MKTARPDSRTARAVWDALDPWKRDHILFSTQCLTFSALLESRGEAEAARMCRAMEAQASPAGPEKAPGVILTAAEQVEIDAARSEAGETTFAAVAEAVADAHAASRAQLVADRLRTYTPSPEGAEAVARAHAVTPDLRLSEPAAADPCPACGRCLRGDGRCPQGCGSTAVAAVAGLSTEALLDALRAALDERKAVRPELVAAIDALATRCSTLLRHVEALFHEVDAVRQAAAGEEVLRG